MERPQLHEKLYWRELGNGRPSTQVRGLYGDRAWVQDLDIVNELGGHTGCVNALSWSKSGRLLASGSDDTHLLIHSYRSHDSNAPFTLQTSLATGHTANIFSVKFMPHSSDRTVITAAGDAECRVFDLEYDGTPATASDASSIAFTRQRRRGQASLFQGTRYLSDGNTNARVYRSHSDRVKRIVTESSPFLFLTCAEDGTVRQWDLRLPSSAYPAPRGGRGFAAHRDGHDDSNIPPPLISYKRYRLDLNTISCSGSQPHYIALGGAHLHCFLHDRRMLGRDRLAERGASVDAENSSTDGADDLMGEATRCVKRFAPGGRNKVRGNESGHVTACKISDANPNEMVGSWSGDHIYSFDLLQSPDARETANEVDAKDIDGKGKGKTRESRDRKRKRKKMPSSTSVDQMASESSKSRRTSAVGPEQEAQDDDYVIRLRYENGQSEDIPVEPTVSASVAEQARESMLNEDQRRSVRIAKTMVKIRKLVFSLDSAVREHQSQEPSLLAAHQASFSNVLGLCASLIPELNHVDRTWQFPTRPNMGEAALHATLRKNRDQSRRFILATGTLARTLGGKLRTAGAAEDPRIGHFREIATPPAEGRLSDPPKAFSYNFLKAICLWLDGGTENVVKGFTKRNWAPHQPIPEDRAGASAIEEFVLPFLAGLADRTRIIEVDASRFERDEDRNLFADEWEAVAAFGHAMRTPLRDLPPLEAAASGEGEADTSTETTNGDTQDGETARYYWGFRVGRGVLMNAGEGINFAFMDRAFGGLGVPRNVEEGRSQEDIDPDVEEEQVRSASLRRRRPRRNQADRQPSEQPASASAERGSSGTSRRGMSASRGDTLVGVEMDRVHSSSASPGLQATEATNGDEIPDEDHEMSDDEGGPGALDASDDDEDDEDDDIDEGDDDDDNEEDAEDDEDGGSDPDFPLEDRHFFWRSLSNRAHLRAQVQRDVPVIPHTRVYRGHCNVKTIKDVNFFGLQDEYVVSGSDSGHFFIWDRKTSQLLNILEGDGEVVNVVQGKLRPQPDPGGGSAAHFSPPHTMQVIPTSPCSPSPASTAPSRSSPRTAKRSSTPAEAATSVCPPATPRPTRPSPTARGGACAPTANCDPRRAPRTTRPRP